MEKQLVDLHVHSTCSDGFYSPQELVAMAVKKGLTAIALADHDNVAGLSAAQQAGIKLGVEVLSAVELSTLWYDYVDMHLLGYGFNHEDPYLIRQLSEFQEFRSGRNRQIIERVNEKLAAEQRQPIDADEVRKLAGGSIGRPHIAQALREAGYVTNNEEAFVRYLVPCNVPKRYFPVDEAISLIHRSGGIAVLAHPPYITRDRQKLEKLVVELLPLGLDGIEAYNNGSNMEDSDWLIKLARKYQLIVTGGSDFHGDPGSNIEIGTGFRGLEIPYRCVEEIRQAQLRRHGK
jgi:predicted metal-dependent phosphoesterase TrpH